MGLLQEKKFNIFCFEKKDLKHFFLFDLIKKEKISKLSPGKKFFGKASSGEKKFTKAFHRPTHRTLMVHPLIANIP